MFVASAKKSEKKRGGDMFVRTDEDFYISKELKSVGLKTPIIEFFLELRHHFEVTDQIKTTTSKLATPMMKSTRTINRYIKELKEKNLLHVRPIYNNKNPDKVYIEYRIFTLTERAKYIFKEALSKLENEQRKDRIKRSVLFEDIA